MKAHPINIGRWAAALVATSFAFALSASAAKPKVVLIKNATIDQGPGVSPLKGSILVRGERIESIGDEAILKQNNNVDVEVDVHGNWVMKGFHDNHVHPIDSGVDLLECPLAEASTLDELFKELKECDEKLDSKATWLRASGWTAFLFSKDVQPNRAMLDRLQLKHAVAIVSGDGHSYWVDSRALKLARITRQTKNPHNGEIVRDAQGEATGVLREDAMQLVEKVLPKRSLDDLKKGLLHAIGLMHAVGITSFKDAFVTPDRIKVYRSLERENRLGATVSLSLFADSDQGVGQIKKFIRLRKAFASKRIRIDTIKIFLDGVLEDRTAALGEPYGETSHRGLMLWNEEKLKTFVQAADRAGFQVHFHAIGDRAISSALNAIEFARKTNGQRSKIRHEIAHLEVIHPRDIKRFAELEVNAVFSPIWATRDESIRNFAEPFLGPTRSQWLYSIGSVLRAGGRLVFGSDWSVTSLNPLEGIQVAMTRLDLDEERRSGQEPWLPNERISRDAAIDAYIDGGRANGVSAGQIANLIVLDQNPFAVDSFKIGDIKTLGLMSGNYLIFKDLQR